MISFWQGLVTTLCDTGKLFFCRAILSILKWMTFKSTEWRRAISQDTFLTRIPFEVCPFEKIIVLYSTMSNFFRNGAATKSLQLWRSLCVQCAMRLISQPILALTQFRIWAISTLTLNEAYRLAELTKVNTVDRIVLIMICPMFLNQKN